MQPAKRDENGDVVSWRMMVHTDDEELAEKVNDLKNNHDMKNVEALKHALREQMQMEADQ